MIVSPIKTRLVAANAQSIVELLDSAIDHLGEESVVAITSKVVALCEGRVVPKSSIEKRDLVKKEADFYLPPSASKHNFQFAIKDRTLTALAGIDESNSGDYYVLWPVNPQKSASEIRKYLKKRFGLQQVGVVITDSTSMPLRWGTLGTALGFSGFKALNNYVGRPDLFGKKMEVSQAGIAMGLAAAAVLAMGEGAERTPLALLTELDFVRFVDHDPTSEELEHFYMKDKEEDLFAPFLNQVKWKRGQGGA